MCCVLSLSPAKVHASDRVPICLHILYLLLFCINCRGWGEISGLGGRSVVRILQEPGAGREHQRITEPSSSALRQPGNLRHWPFALSPDSQCCWLSFLLYLTRQSLVMTGFCKLCPFPATVELINRVLSHFHRQASSQSQ